MVVLCLKDSKFNKQKVHIEANPLGNLNTASTRSSKHCEL